MSLGANKIVEKFGSSGWENISTSGYLAGISVNFQIGTSPSAVDLTFVENYSSVSGYSSHSEFYGVSDIVFNQLDERDLIRVSLPSGLSASGTTEFDPLGKADPSHVGLVFVGEVIDVGEEVGPGGVTARIVANDLRQTLLSKTRIFTTDFVSSTSGSVDEEICSVAYWYRLENKLRPDENVSIQQAEINKIEYRDIIERGATYSQIYESVQYYYDNIPSLVGIDPKPYNLIPDANAGSGIVSSLRWQFNGNSLLDVVNKCSEDSGYYLYWTSNVPSGTGWGGIPSNPSGQLNVVSPTNFTYQTASGFIEYLEGLHNDVPLSSRAGKTKDSNPSRVVLYGGQKTELLRYVPLEPMWNYVPVRYQDSDGSFCSYIPAEAEYKAALQGKERWIDFCTRVETVLPDGKTDLTTYTDTNGLPIVSIFSNFYNMFQDSNYLTARHVFLARKHGMDAMLPSGIDNYPTLADHQTYETWLNEWFRRVENNAKAYYGKMWGNRNFLNYQVETDMVGSTGSWTWDAGGDGFEYSVDWLYNHYDRRDVDIVDSAWVEGLDDYLWYNGYRNEIQFRKMSDESGIYNEHLTPFVTDDLRVKSHMIIRDFFLGWEYEALFNDDFSNSYNEYKKRFVFGLQAEDMPGVGFTEYYEGDDPFASTHLGYSQDFRLTALPVDVKKSEDESALSAEYDTGQSGNYTEFYPKGTVLVKPPTIIGQIAQDTTLKTLAMNWQLAFSYNQWLDDQFSFDSGLEVFTPGTSGYYVPDSNGYQYVGSSEMLASIPIKVSDRYGPWIIGSGSQEQTAYIFEDSLVPWNFISFPSGVEDDFYQMPSPTVAMNTYGSGLAESYITGYGKKAFANATFAGFPLLDSSDYDTFPFSNVNVSISTAGIMSSYSSLEFVHKKALQPPRKKDLQGLEIGRPIKWRPYPDYQSPSFGFETPKGMYNPIIYEMTPSSGIGGKTTVTIIGENLYDKDQSVSTSYAIFTSLASASGTVTLITTPTEATYTEEMTGATLNSQELSVVVPWDTASGPVYVSKVIKKGYYTDDPLGSGVTAATSDISLELQSNSVEFNVLHTHASDKHGGAALAVYAAGTNMKYPAT